MAIIEEGSCLIKFINKQGLGSGKSALGVVEVPYVLPEEIITFERHKYRRQSNCLLKSIKNPSIHRITPECKYFERCGGCMLQHMDLQTYNNFKLSLIKNALPPETIINPIITIPQGNRRRVNLQAIKKDSHLFLGFHRFHSHQIIDIDNCPAMMSSLSAIITPLKRVLTGILQHRQKAEIFLTQATNGIDMLLELPNIIEITLEQQIKLKEFVKKAGIIRLQFLSSQESIFLLESEKPYILLGDKKVVIDAKCFIQTSFASDKILADLVNQYLPQDKGALVDLFCGRGTFSLALNKRFSVEGFESDAQSLEALAEAAEGAITLHKRDLFISPLSKDELERYRFAVINPPRAGALEQVRTLASSKCERVVYISCNPESFARDTAILEKGGYKLLEVTPVDQFYWSSHLEVVGVFISTSL